MEFESGPGEGAADEMSSRQRSALPASIDSIGSCHPRVMVGYMTRSAFLRRTSDGRRFQLAEVEILLSARVAARRDFLFPYVHGSCDRCMARKSCHLLYTIDHLPGTTNAAASAQMISMWSIGNPTIVHLDVAKVSSRCSRESCH